MIKKMGMACLLLLMATVALHAQDVKKEIVLEGSPTSIEVANMIDVEVIASNRNAVVAEADQLVLKYFFCTYSKGKLELYQKRDKAGDKAISLLKKSEKENRIRVKLYVTNVERISSIELSGISTIELETNGVLALEDLEISGISYASIKGQMNKLEVDCSGVSKIDLQGSAKSVELDVSGVSGVELHTLSIDKLEAEVSGASHATLRGKINLLKAEVSGASSLKSDGAEINQASCEASGASTIRIKPNQFLKRTTSGASSIK